MHQPEDPQSEDYQSEDHQPEEVDVVIIGAGPAGLTLATWMAVSGVSTLVIDKKSGPVECGRADGLEPRTWEILDSFGLATVLWERSNKTVELSHWKSSGPDGIHRIARRPNAALGVSRYMEATLHQGFIEKTLLSNLKLHKNIHVLWNSEPLDLEVHQYTTGCLCGKSRKQRPVAIDISSDGRPRRRVRCKYVVGCDGAHSWTRKYIGIPFEGEAEESRWGVVDIIPETDFPEMRNRCIVEGGKAGNMMIIPREDHLVRLYAQLDYAHKIRNFDELSAEDVLGQARLILAPYKLSSSRVDWVTKYNIGRRVAPRAISECGRILLCGDAIHCQSPKSGMGMNTGMQDSYNLGWKLASVIRGYGPASLLETYEAERLPVARQLISFDRKFCRKFTEGFGDSGKDSNERCVEKTDLDKAIDEEHFGISGISCDYAKMAPESWVGMRESTLPEKSAPIPKVANNLELGRRIPDVQLVKHCGGDVTWLHNHLRSTGKWYLLVFPGNIADQSSLRQSLHQLATSDAFCELISRHHLLSTLTIHASSRVAFDLTDLPSSLTGATYGQGLYQDHVLADSASYHCTHGQAYKKLFGEEEGQEQQRLILLRPDMHVAFTGKFDDFKALRGWFEKTLLPELAKEAQ